MADESRQLVEDRDALEEENRNGGAEKAPPEDVAALTAAVASLHEELTAQTTRAQGLQGRVDALERELGMALERYRRALLEASPELPEELVAGETAEELEASVARARSLVERVRSRVEAEAARGRVPAGAPPRRAPDLSALSPYEKISLGLDRR